jgi:3-deoxy-D-manno-octulosonate 8-phosphate phosphatase (KDO 8-P phosphatase)
MTTTSLAAIKALAFDVDGVLTDGTVLWGTRGEEFKRFGFTDIMGLSLARRAGYHIALISGENSPLVDRYAEKLHIPFVRKGTRDKAEAMREFATSTGTDLLHTLFMGDDLNDLPAMRLAGHSAAPSNAVNEVLAHVTFRCTKSGGNGAVRELIDALLLARGLDPEAVFQIKLS